jgi:hypothetical protein
LAAAVPGLPNIQPVKPAAKKKTISAIVATAKLWSARRHRSGDLVRGLAFMFPYPIGRQQPQRNMRDG